MEEKYSSAAMVVAVSVARVAVSVARVAVSVARAVVVAVTVANKVTPTLHLDY